jgi:hypothetical protein
MLGDLPKNDLNGDGRSDIIWLSNGGYTSVWTGGTGGTFSMNWQTFGLNAAIVDVADFTNKGRQQVLLHNNAFGGETLHQFELNGSNSIDYNYDGGSPLHAPWT